MVYTAENRKVTIDKTSGAQYWAVKLDKLMFTWFEVSPFSSFPAHAHESEQITYVLEGELYFEVDSEVHCLKAGDCIAIPSGKEHSVWTEATGAKAVDAWSPVNKQYQ